MRMLVDGSPMIARRSLAAAFLSIALLALGCKVPRPTHPAEGRVMGSLPIVSLDDATLPVPSLTGKVTLLNFWGTWCPPCRKELPGLVRISQRLNEEPRFQLIAVSCGSGGEDANLARETTSFLSARQLPIAAWGFSEAVIATHFSLAYGLEAFPTTYLIGPDARVRRVWTGYRSSDEADIAAAILVLLKEQGP
ncbi:MAG: TlpA family protein disulfide reductase [Planctomycetota bacterium]|nr:MAG: TlpA family protein disulfide reductase [Planctomycetota bacterium]